MPKSCLFQSDCSAKNVVQHPSTFLSLPCLWVLFAEKGRISTLWYNIARVAFSWQILSIWRFYRIANPSQCPSKAAQDRPPQSPACRLLSLKQWYEAKRNVDSMPSSTISGSRHPLLSRRPPTTTMTALLCCTIPTNTRKQKHQDIIFSKPFLRPWQCL